MESSDINKVRGKLLFWKTIEDSGLPEKMMSRAKELGKGFEDLVGVSAYEGLYPAKRFAEAILEVSTWDYDLAGFDLGPDQVTKYYNEKLGDKHPVAIKSSSYIPSGEKLDGSWGREVTNEADDFEKQIRSAALAEGQEESIDLLEDGGHGRVRSAGAAPGAAGRARHPFLRDRRAGGQRLRRPRGEPRP